MRERTGGGGKDTGEYDAEKQACLKQIKPVLLFLM
jgi:hypothetical protein